jgi:hypothetical protein
MESGRFGPRGSYKDAPVVSRPALAEAEDLNSILPAGSWSIEVDLYTVVVLADELNALNLAEFIGLPRCEISCLVR